MTAVNRVSAWFSSSHIIPKKSISSSGQGTMSIFWSMVSCVSRTARSSFQAKVKAWLPARRMSVHSSRHWPSWASC